jgi:hypothetical protein
MQENLFPPAVAAKLKTINTTFDPRGETCGEACWYAKEDVCRCSCEGRNHGIMRHGDGQRPERTCHRHSTWYKLIAITSYDVAFNLEHDEYGRWLKKYGHGTGKLYPSSFRFYEKASTSQLKWQEVKNITLKEDSEKYLVWERTDVQKYW